MASTLAAFRSVLNSQYHAALAMLGDAIQRCPDNLWLASDHMNAFWQIAYHTLFFTHLYLQPDEAAFRPWQHHQSSVQHPDGIAGAPDPNSSLPLIPAPYTKAQVLEYWSFCDQMVDEALDKLDLENSQSGFPWYRMSKLEHQLVNLRHIQHHEAQLADRLRSAANIGIKWVKGCPPS
ncbi:MAG TPA: DinB family protein [Candidatus Acidoferrum sp.]|nr:DinB family protein [Candidatus Acidoferrum sp.]